ncbi:proteasome subunit beta type-2-like [Centruroides sculpturatus]|uniref:proteasome subunit beta type-2-like n=1 Tax=Centruroides sculpturatus TaxID=218467 RepID=UPI000C6CDEC1|nr:proteasome subunit beta type-2-like [Centruroides sculpturatus]
MECLIGITFDDFVLLASDKMVTQNIIMMKKDDNKQYPLSDHLLMAVSGEPGDTVQFAEFIAKNIQLYKLRNGYELSPSAAANFTRRYLADFLRSRSPYRVNLLLAGFDSTGPDLYYIDFLAAMVKLPYGAHGYGSFFNLSILDRYYRSDMTEEEGMALLKKCVQEIKDRFIVSLSSFHVNKIDKNGIHHLSDITV